METPTSIGTTLLIILVIVLLTGRIETSPPIPAASASSPKRPAMVSLWETLFPAC
jgi:hypothetical protein